MAAHICQILALFLSHVGMFWALRHSRGILIQYDGIYVDNDYDYDICFLILHEKHIMYLEREGKDTLNL